ncbi:MAG: nicotinate-nucleotide--dimethylbenzimidazole phosphoribosyltransferase [Desulfovibrio sp.]|nr:nicotinate-nucleotide--dimethylbenzimidazole phosphoribosyltransferase [Desulfovibrio sp.]
MTLLKKLFPGAKFESVSEALVGKARERLDRLTKPVGSLGRVEAMAEKLYAINGGQTPLSVTPGIFYIFAGDHGVAQKNVSPYPREVTRQMVANFLRGGAAINCLTRAFDLSLRIVDAGCVGESFPPSPALLERKLGNGTDDFTVGPAMSVETCEKGLREGFALAENASLSGFRCVGVGEMGIANTTSAAALYSVFLNLDPSKAVGPGTGASPEMIERKVEVIRAAVKANSESLESRDPLRLLAAFGGFEIVEMAGIMLGCAAFRLPFIVDGFISAAAYIAARAFFPDIAGYAFLSHKSAEPGYAFAMERIGESPYLDFGMRLGEGTGAALLYPMLRGACAIFNDMATMEEAGVSGEEG